MKVKSLFFLALCFIGITSVSAGPFKIGTVEYDSLAAAIDAKDSYTHGHSRRVTDLSVGIALEMNLPKSYSENELKEKTTDRILAFRDENIYNWKNSGEKIAEYLIENGKTDQRTVLRLTVLIDVIIPYISTEGSPDRRLCKRSFLTTLL